MIRQATILERRALVALACAASVWGGALSGCAEEVGSTGGGGATAAGAGGTGTVGAGAAGGGGGDFGGNTGTGGNDVCESKVVKAEQTPLDMIFLLDWSQSMQGASWSGTKVALQTFFEDPLSAGINAGMVFSPTVKPFGPGNQCIQDLFKVLDVPIAPLPDNAFALVNSMPQDALGGATPTYASVSGALMAATAYQDAHPTHKVVLVMTGDGDYNSCPAYDIDDIAAWANAALNYNGVRTYVIAVQSSTISFDNLEKIAIQGGTDVVYDAQNISDFSAQMADIRTAVLGCDFEIPPPPEGEFFMPSQTNVTYTPAGMGDPITLPRADNLADCGDKPGWYFDNNQLPSKIIICPASCSTIQNDTEAEVAAAFGCASVPN